MRFFRNISPFLGGVLLAVGLGVSGMTQPQKIIGFLNFLGDWDPTLLFVMCGAVITYALSFRLIRKRSSPFFTEKFYLPTRKDIDLKLIIGSMIFGVGWGLAGYCPGPGLTALASGTSEAIFFSLSMFAGMALFQFVNYLSVDK